MKIKSIKKSPAPKAVVKARVKAAPSKQAAKKSTLKNVTFTIHAEKGKSVYLAGEFNQWNPSAKKMAYRANAGLYSATIKLAPGDYQYKFIIDGTWCADPENANAVPNDQGTFNSVITVK